MEGEDIIESEGNYEVYVVSNLGHNHTSYPCEYKTHINDTSRITNTLVRKMPWQLELIPPPPPANLRNRKVEFIVEPRY